MRRGCFNDGGSGGAAHGRRNINPVVKRSCLVFSMRSPFLIVILILVILLVVVGCPFRSLRCLRRSEQQRQRICFRPIIPIRSRPSVICPLSSSSSSSSVQIRSARRKKNTQTRQTFSKRVEFKPRTERKAHLPNHTKIFHPIICWTVEQLIFYLDIEPGKGAFLAVEGVVSRAFDAGPERMSCAVVLVVIGDTRSFCIRRHCVRHGVSWFSFIWDMGHGAVVMQEV